MLKEMYCGKNAAVTEVEDFFENISLEWINSQKPQVKLSTYAKYYNVLKLYLNPTFGQKHISQITRSEVLEFSRMMLTIGGSKRNGLTPKTINGALSVLKNIFWFAEVEKSCAVADIKNISVRQPQKAMRILTRSEQIALSDYLCVNQTPCHLGILLCLYTGMRIGEICALKWGDIHIDEQYLYIHQSMQRVQTSTVSKSKTVVLIQSPKSECSIRKIPIPAEILQLLIPIKQPDEAFLLTGMTHKFLEPRSLENRFKSIINECGIENTNFHSLRHPYVKHTTKIFSLRLMDFQAQAYPDARRKTRGACQLRRGGQSQSPVHPLCNRKRFSYLPPQSKISRILYAISMRLSGYTSTRSISSSASSVVSASASKIALDASFRLSCRACSSCFCFACANTAA